MLPDNAVENIERRGQGILVKDDTLPTLMGYMGKRQHKSVNLTRDL
jgi:hypothetical protein